MTYPPGNAGYPPAQQPPGGSYGASTPGFTQPEAGPSKLPFYLNIAVVALGLAAYLSSFLPMYDIDSPLGSLSVGGSYVSIAGVLAALLAAVALIPKGKSYLPIVAVISVLGALLAISNLFDKPASATIGSGRWWVLACIVVQAIAAVGALLLDAGVITAPAPRPKYDQYGQYGLPPGGYYGQTGQTGQQQGGYYGGYPAGPPSGGFSAQQAPSTGGFGVQPTQAVQQQAPQTPNTPPTGFPTYGQPPSGGATGGEGQSGQAPPSGPSQS